MDFLKSTLILFQLLPLARTINTMFLPCDTDDNVTTIDCSDRPIIRVPAIKSTTVVTVDFSRTKIRQVELRTFSGMPNLLTLKMTDLCKPGYVRASEDSSCQLKIDSCAFKSLKKLQNLYLSGNYLTTIPCLPESLRLLDLQSNKIVSITRPLNTPNLQQLLLSQNCFYQNPCYQSYYISEIVFRQLCNLKNLTLGFNNLTSVPSGLPTSLESLDLRENAITEVSEGTFANLTLLKYLNLEWNCQRCDHAARPCFPCPDNHPLKLFPNTFNAEESSIMFLSLRGNSLRSFPVGLFRPLTNLKSLDLSDNLLSKAIRDGTFFTELKGLTWISLIYNYEPQVTFQNLILPQQLANMSRLKFLLLSGNFFHELSNSSFNVLSKLHSLTNLELRMNFINTIDLRLLKQSPSLIDINLSQNMLNFLPNCMNPSSEITPLQSSSGNFTRHTRDLPLISIHQDFIDGSHSRESDRSPKEEMLEYNVLRFPSIFEFKKHFCSHNLSIDLSQNDILSLNKMMFAGMENAVCLDLSFNYMSQTLAGGMFNSMKKLVFLNLSNNRLDLYYKEAFSELNQTLKALDLSHNEFHFKMKGMGHSLTFLQNLVNLHVLSLANNGMEARIGQRLISSSLKCLYFNGNRLDIMWGSGKNEYIFFFQNLTSLVYLDISDNNLRLIEQDILPRFPKSIKSLRISHNQMVYFPWENIYTLRNLAALDLSHNSLARLPNEVIEFGAEFTVLNLSNNNLESIPLDFFSEAKYLQYLYLSNNQITALNQQFFPGPFNNGSALQVLTLHGNPFICDCDTSWFSDFLRTTTTNIPYLTTAMTCEYPVSQRSKSILSMDQRSCQDIYGGLAFLVSSFLVTVLTVLPLLKHLYGWDVWYCLQVVWAGLKGYSQLVVGDSPNRYDAFVTFDTSNQAVRDWVYNELTVQLENTGHRRFCLCLEERDWIPGLSCIENLHSAVYSSVKTVFVLSRSGDSANGIIRQAFYMVQQRLLDEKVDVAVLVLLDEMFPKLKYLQLRKRLCKKSVLSWPRNPKAQPLFWNQMRIALSSDNLKFYDQNMSESFI